MNEKYSIVDKVVEAAAFLLLVIISLWIVMTPVVQFIVVGRSPYMTLSIWYVAEIWYWLFGGRKYE